MRKETTKLRQQTGRTKDWSYSRDVMILQMSVFQQIQSGETGHLKFRLLVIGGQVVTVLENHQFELRLRAGMLGKRATDEKTNMQSGSLLHVFRNHKEL